MARTSICGLLRFAWDSVGRIVTRVVDRLDERRLQGLVCIGVDEISYRRHHRYLTSVADHRRGAIVWCRPGRNGATLAEFFAELGDRKGSIRVVSIDMSGDYQRAIRQGSPMRRSALTRSTSSGSPPARPTRSRRDEWNAHERSHTATDQWVKGTRWSLLKAPERQTIGQLATLWEVQTHNRRLYRAFLLREELRLLYHLPEPALAPAHLDVWLAWASRSSRSFGSRAACAHRDGILADIQLGLSNGRSRASTARSGSSATAATASTPPTP